MVCVVGIREPDSARHMLQDKGILGYFIQPLVIENQGANSLMSSIATDRRPPLNTNCMQKGWFSTWRARSWFVSINNDSYFSNISSHYIIEVIISFYCILLLFPPSLLLGKRCISDLLPSGSHMLLFYGRITYVCTEKLKVIHHSALWRGLPGSTHTALNEPKWESRCSYQSAISSIQHSCDSISGQVDMYMSPYLLY